MHRKTNKNIFKREDHPTSGVEIVEFDSFYVIILPYPVTDPGFPPDGGVNPPGRGVNTPPLDPPLSSEEKQAK